MFKMYRGHNSKKPVAEREFNNPMGKYTMKVVKGNETVDQLPREFSRIAWHFHAHSDKISVEGIGHRQHCKELCGEMEISCQLEFSFTNKVQMKCSKELPRV